jgi:hypothetical protein
MLVKIGSSHDDCKWRFNIPSLCLEGQDRQSLNLEIEMRYCGSPKPKGISYLY